MSRQDRDPETQLALQGPKGPRQEDRLAQSEAPRTLSPTISTLPFIRGFQDNMTSWMSSLISEQDGCLRIVAHQASQGKLRQEQLAQTVARSAPSTSSTSGQVQYLCAQLPHRDAQLEHVGSGRDTHFVQERDLLAHVHLLSSEAKDWKSRVVSEAEHVLCKESAEAAHRTIEVQEAMDKQFQARWRQAEAELRDMCEPNSAQLQTLAVRLRESSISVPSSLGGVAGEWILNPLIPTCTCVKVVQFVLLVFCQFYCSLGSNLEPLPFKRSVLESICPSLAPEKALWAPKGLPFALELQVGSSSYSAFFILGFRGVCIL